ncbi:MAG: hypothetical protein HY270_01120 [Deltaproteobacteria bacterium]|nr:hypothetical protein [Deltaproteobacteria bacterium]
MGEEIDMGARRLLMAQLVALTLSAPLQASGSHKEPDGFAKAKFGMRLSQVQSLYPKLAPVSSPTAATNQADLPLTLHTYRLDHQAFGPLKDCQIDLHFVATKTPSDPELYEVHFLCPDKRKVLEYLQDLYGGPTTATQSGLLWTGEKVDITEVPNTGAFLFGDKVRTAQVHLTLLNYLMSHNQPAAPSGDVAPPANSPQ